MFILMFVYCGIYVSLLLKNDDDDLSSRRLDWYGVGYL